MFYGCTSLATITIPDSVTSIGRWAFSNCTWLNSVYITDVAKWCAIEFYDAASNPLYYADNLYVDGKRTTELIIPDSVTSINDYAFCGWIGIKGIMIPDSVTSIGKYAFYKCTSLTSIYYNGTEDEWSGISISSNNSPLTNATRYYYSEVEPPLNTYGTAYEGKYWYFDENGNITVWVYIGSNA